MKGMPRTTPPISDGSAGNFNATPTITNTGGMRYRMPTSKLSVINPRIASIVSLSALPA